MIMYFASNACAIIPPGKSGTGDNHHSYKILSELWNERVNHLFDTSSRKMSSPLRIQLDMWSVNPASVGGPRTCEPRHFGGIAGIGSVDVIGYACPPVKLL